MIAYIKKFSQISLQDIKEVGGKNASLGELYNRLSEKGIRVPDGYATTADAFQLFLQDNGLNKKLLELLQSLDQKNFTNLAEIGSKARSLILDATLSPELSASIIEHYKQLCEGQDSAVAVRSSATAEDLPQASFAGQHESYLNVKGNKNLLNAVHQCFASLYTDRAIKYRIDQGFAHDKVYLSVGIQKMVRSDKACSGVAFTLEPESGFRGVIHISGVWGLGENLVQGTINPDEFLVFKPTLMLGYEAIIQKHLGDKVKTMIFTADETPASVENVDTPLEKQNALVLTNNEIIQVARWCYSIEQHYGKPMDIEWAKDGENNNIYIIQARPETVQSARNYKLVKEYEISKDGKPVTTGQAVGSKVATGRARVLHSPKEVEQVKDDEIVVTEMTSPDWDPVLKKTAAIVTNKGGRTSHASIVARELGVPAVVGCNNATEVIHDGEWITVSCCEGNTGKVYKGKIPFSIREIDFSKIVKPESTEVMLIMSDPEKAFTHSFYPTDGVGLLRIELIINHMIQIHPMALASFDQVQDVEARKKIEELTHNYADKKEYFVEKLAEGIATIAAAFYPRDVIVRLSDFKTNEYANLIGGKVFEPKEENPMLGFRGASRYYNPLYQPGFALECEAVKKARERMGLTNIKIMIPFCRTIEEATQVVQELTKNKLDRKKDDSLKIYMMVEIPSNVLLEEKFAEIFDGFSIGSNDLTQLTLGIDRDSGIIGSGFNELNEASTLMISMAIEKAIKAGRPIGLCGQAPSDFPAFTQFLVEKRIHSISFNADALLRGIENIRRAEQKVTNEKKALSYS
jgi:phosphoenolpyruvate synthase